MCTKGEIKVGYRGEMIRIAKGDLFIRVPRATEKGPYEVSEDFEFKQLSVPIQLFEGLMFDHIRIEPRWWQKLEYLKENPIFHLQPKSVDVCNAYFELLRLQLIDQQTEYRKQILMLVARGTTMELLNYMDKTLSFDDEGQTRQSSNTSDYTFNAFTQLLREYPHKREVQWYAAQLKITPKYLSEICKERSGKSASEWIAEITVSEIKHYLRNTTLPIREVASVMEFPNASFFCQYTKKHTGLTPNHFRKQKKV
jgi:YesN/AraC family two-component response regulator